MATFALDLERFQAKVSENAKGTIKKIILEMFSRVVKRTPVDTGAAQNSWEIGINAIPGGHEVILGGEFGQVSQAQINKALASLAEFQIGDVAYIVSNIEYIGFLEEGKPGPGSIDAPHGMVKITVREFQTIVDEFTVEV
jgi:hypothetical protein